MMDVTRCGSRLRIAKLAVTVGLGLVSSGLSAEPDDAVDAAMRSWDVQKATEMVVDLRPEAGPCATDLARADLAVASMLRVEFEAEPDGRREARRVLGQRIDVYAEEGLEALADCPESSERWRIEADLLATMIRSNFRAKKYEDRLKGAIDRALELDETNARAWVSSAKPFLYAEERHGGDPVEAVRRLDRALELHPDLESALVLRAYAHDLLGRPEAARADLDRALRLNPQCRPARSARDRDSGSARR